MKAMTAKYETIDQYIANFPADIQAVLQEIRATIKKAAPEAAEKISYGIPTFFLKGNLVHFAGYKTHFGFYPVRARSGSLNKNSPLTSNPRAPCVFRWIDPCPWI